MEHIKQRLAISSQIEIQTVTGGPSRLPVTPSHPHPRIAPPPRLELSICALWSLASSSKHYVLRSTTWSCTARVTYSLSWRCAVAGIPCFACPFPVGSIWVVCSLVVSWIILLQTHLHTPPCEPVYTLRGTRIAAELFLEAVRASPTWFSKATDHPNSQLCRSTRLFWLALALCISL